MEREKLAERLENQAELMHPETQVLAAAGECEDCGAGIGYMAERICRDCLQKTLLAAAAALREGGERIEGCHTDTTYYAEFDGHFSINVSLPDGATLQRCLDRRAVLVLLPEEESNA